MRPRCSILTGGFEFSGCGDCASCPPFEQTETSNSEPSAMVLQDIVCMRGLYQVSIRMEKTNRRRRLPRTSHEDHTSGRDWRGQEGVNPSGRSARSLLPSIRLNG